jgi:hypothetical protein
MRPIADIPDDLLEARKQAVIAAKQSPEHDLSPGFQLAIVRALGPCPKPDRDESVWARRKVLLDVLSVDKVLSLWDTVYPNSETPRILLAEARKAFTPAWNVERSSQLVYSQYWTHFDGVDQGNPVSYVLHAALAALSVTITVVTRPSIFFSSPIDYSLSNVSLSLEEQSSAFLASCAYAGGPSWNTRSDNERRHAYWIWWVQDAVVTVCQESH